MNLTITKKLLLLIIIISIMMIFIFSITLESIFSLYVSLYSQLFEFYNAITFTLFILEWLRLILILCVKIYFHRLLFKPAFLYNRAELYLLSAYIIILIIIYPAFLLSIHFFLSIILLVLLILIDINFKSYKVLKFDEEELIKKNILDLGTQFVELELIDIAERCALNQEKIELVLKEMISNKEIYAWYSIEGKLIKFNQDLNIEEIDSLMLIYKQWESERIKKKI